MIHGHATMECTLWLADDLNKYNKKSAESNFYNFYRDLLDAQSKRNTVVPKLFFCNVILDGLLKDTV